MQHFVHDVLSKNLDPMKWEVLGSDTDSVAVALAHRSIDQCVADEHREDWTMLKPKYFVDDSTPEAYARTSRTPLLFKEEITSADLWLAPSSKCYFAGK